MRRGRGARCDDGDPGRLCRNARRARSVPRVGPARAALPAHHASAAEAGGRGGRWDGAVDAGSGAGRVRAAARALPHAGRPAAHQAAQSPRPSSPPSGHWRRHRDLVVDHAPAVQQAFLRYKRDLNVLVSRGIWRMFRVAETEYRRTLDAHAVLDFSDVLLRALDLLRQMEEFAQSRYRLESRYHHVLVDEFQDTSRAQWELVSLLVAVLGRGRRRRACRPAASPRSSSSAIASSRFTGFAMPTSRCCRRRAATSRRCGPTGDVRRSISRSFRSVPALLAFVNDVCQDMEKLGGAPRRVRLRRTGSVSDRRRRRSSGAGASAPCSRTRRRPARRSRRRRSHG